VAWRRKSCGDVTVAIDLDHLRGALKHICPGVDWSWLLIITKRIAAAAPRRHPKCHLVTSDRLYALGLELMDSALTDADAAKRISKAHAFQYRDGLIITLRALIPLRSRTVVAMNIGSHLVKTGDLWRLDIPAEDTKNRRPLDYPIPREIVRAHRLISRPVPQPDRRCRKTHRRLGVQSESSDVRHGHL
jgi:hypothetical protein